MRLIAIAVLVSAYFLGQAQQNLIQSPEPSWVTDYRYDDGLPETLSTSEGFAYLLVSQQRHLETKESYWKIAMKVVSEPGLSTVSSVNVSFDPAYQKVLFHTLRVVRNGKTIDKLDIRKFELLRREDEMDRAVYDKTLDAIYNLPDVRVGDVVEYSYTVKGSNPVFEDHTFGTMYLEYGVPVGKFAYRLVFSAGRPLQFKANGNAGTPKQTATGNLKSLEWIRDNVPALLNDDMLPSWYDPFDHVQYTDFQSWQKVKSWALNLYEPKGADSRTLKEIVQQIRALPLSDEEKIKWCIRIVQADIRYLSFSDGVNGYKPHAPGMVYDQKYGDCKDKSLLLSYLLNGIEIESYPALVSTVNGQIMDDLLPDPWAFNHCIVQFIFNDSTYWVDPTMRPQVGPLKRYHIPTYEKALVINNGSDGLEPIPFGYKDSMIDVVEEYRMGAVDGEVTLEVTSRYIGDEADLIRKYREDNTREAIHKNYLNFYAREYSEISLLKDVTFRDDTAQNVMTTFESYLLGNFWVPDSLTNRTTGSVYAGVIAGYVKKPDTQLRTMPLVIAYPQHVRQTIKVYLPQSWNVRKESTDIESDGFLYHSSVDYMDRIITLQFEYRAKASFVDHAATADHINKLNKVLDDLTYNISKGYEETESTSTNYFILALLLGGGVYFVRKRWR